jgi:hypothetical protein
MLTRRNALLAPGLLALVGCQPPSLRVEVSGSPGAIGFSASRGEGPFGLVPRPAPIGRASIQQWPGHYLKSKVWEIVEVGGCQPNLTRIQYGVVPAGFEETTPAQPILPDRIYLADIEGCAFTNSPGIAASTGQIRKNLIG